MTPRIGSTSSPASSDATDPLWKALAIYRAATVVYVVVTYGVLAEYYRRPELGWVVVAALATWTVVVSALYRRPDRRTWPILSADLSLALLAVLLNPVIDQPDRIEAGEPTMALIWPTGALLAWAIRWGWRGGVGAAAALSVASLLARGELTRSTGNNIVLMILAGAVIGYAVDLFRLSERTMQQAVRLEAATRERERLSRSIHDGVLQVLALVQRRGPDLGAEGAELAQLAEEQQEALRGLLIAHPESTSAELVDVAAAIAALGSSTVSVATPGEPVWLPGTEGDELLSAINACLDNVRTHVGPDAPAWVLLEEESDRIVVTVRDQGPGFAEGRLQAAADAGRLGVAQSIRGRIEDLGGTAEFVSTPGEGTEVELTLPRPAAT